MAGGEEDDTVYLAGGFDSVEAGRTGQIQWTSTRPDDEDSRPRHAHWLVDDSKLGSLEGRRKFDGMRWPWSDRIFDGARFEVLPEPPVAPPRTMHVTDDGYLVGAGQRINLFPGVGPAQAPEPAAAPAAATVKASNPKDAVGSKKAPLSVVPFPPLYEAAAGMLEGACKYRRHNYREIGVRASVYFDAAMRHLTSWWEGQDIDPESGIHHISKVLSCLLVLRDAQMSDKCYDDRPPRAFEGWEKATQEIVDAVLARHPNPKPPYTIEGEPK